ncbi:sensor histidine kinase [Thiohalobacter sp. COW1]|uniref:sensor histidine kinase n=1 Tax=Thiohalobacter sp. COW1 TaxID=2795687 RepID=UPI001915D0ED|nr:ATP-binding protein [Thiohalobacter sp. COW1]BCO31074.1 sensor histidine kinase [Thiohalobacter sp. COW1]
MAAASAQPDPQQLQEAFQAFNRMSSALEHSYRELEQQVAGLNRELAASRSERLQLADRLETLIAALPGGVLVLDADDRVSECNPMARDLLGTPLVGATWDSIRRHCFDAPGSDGHDIRLYDGRWIRISERPLDAGTGRILLINEITETRRLTEALNRQQRLSAMGEMLAGLAHQLRTPLSAALLYASQLSGMDSADHRPQQLGGRIVERLRHLERMVNDMLAFARGGQGGEAEALPLGRLLQTLEQQLEPQLAGVDWHCDCSDPQVPVQGDETALVGALSNLVINARQAAVQTPVIRVTAEQQADGAVLIRVSDNGPGIPADVCEHIFEPFFTTRAKGTGLGLAVVRATVEAHRGEISVLSEAGAGTTFSLRLPPAPLAGALASGAAGADISKQGVQA